MELLHWPQRILMSLFHRYAICIGMSSYLYEHRTHTFKQTRFTRWLALLVNAVTVLLLPLVVWDALYMTDGYDVSLLVFASCYVNTVVRVLVVLYTVVMRARRERQLCKIVSAMQQLDREYLAHFPQNAAIERRFSSLFYVKFALLLYMMLAAPILLFSRNRRWHWYIYMLSIFYVRVMNVLYVTVFSYFLLYWGVCRRYRYINVQLRSLLEQLQEPEQRRTDSGHARLQRLLRWHWQLDSMVLQLNSSYHLQMLAIRFTCIVTNVMSGYLAIVFSFDYDTPWITIFLSVISYFVMNGELYLVDMMCDMTVKERNVAAQLLRGFNELQPGGDGVLQKDVEQFALQMSCTELRVNIAGLFVVDKSLWFVMSASIVSYTIVLVQFHIVWNKKGY